MESKGIIKDVVNGKIPYRIPLFDRLLNDAAIEYFSGEKLTIDNAKEVVPLAISKMLDGTRTVKLPQNPKVIKYPDGTERHINRWTSWTKKNSNTSLKDMIKVFREEIESDNDDFLQSWPNVRKYQEIQKSINDTVFFFPQVWLPFVTLIRWLGMEKFSFFLNDFPDLAKRLLVIRQEKLITKLKKWVKDSKSPAGFILADIAYKNSLMFSKKTLYKYGFFEHIEEICKIFHNNNIKIIYHSDGDISSIIPDLISAGVDGINPIEKAAGMDIIKIHKEYPELVLVGGIDVTHLMRKGSKKEVEKEVIKIANEIGTDGKWLAGSSTELGDDIPLDNILTMVDTLWNFKI